MLEQGNRRLDILELIHKHPGITTNDISKKINVPKTTCLFHINNLKEKQQIKTNLYGKKRFFSEDISNNEMKLWASLRTNSSKKIIFCLLENDIITFQDISKNIDKSKSTISTYLKKLIDEQVVLTKWVNNEKMYFLSDKNRLKELIKKFNFKL